MPTPLLAPYLGLPPLISSNEDFADAIDVILSGTGPVAIDAERASGYRYSQRAYLIQIKRKDGGLHLIDPIAITDQSLWRKLNDALVTEEWVIHASTQDLPCMRELGIYPQRLFDTELGGRIAGCERVGLGPLTEFLLDIALAKEHSAVDWSLRPLKSEWLTYAALDVEVLLDLRDAVEKLLTEQGKLEWALEDFAAILEAPLNQPRKDPWRRTSGMHKVRDRQTLAVIKSLWHARDEYAREIDLAPGRVFNDETLIEIATKKPSAGDIERIVRRRSKASNPPIAYWRELIENVIVASPDTYPDLRTPSTGLPPIKTWQQRNPLGYARLTHARAAIAEASLELSIPIENLISPDYVRKLCWQVPQPSMSDEEALEYVQSMLEDLGARPWQVAQLAPILAGVLYVTAPLEVQAVETGEPTNSAE